MEHFNLTKDDCIQQAAKLIDQPHTRILFVAENVKDTFVVRDRIAELFLENSDVNILRLTTGQLVLSNGSCVLIQAPTKYTGRGLSICALLCPLKAFSNEDFVASVIPALPIDANIYKY